MRRTEIEAEDENNPVKTRRQSAAVMNVRVNATVKARLYIHL